MKKHLIDISEEKMSSLGYPIRAGTTPHMKLVSGMGTLMEQQKVLYAVSYVNSMFFDDNAPQQLQLSDTNKQNNMIFDGQLDLGRVSQVVGSEANLLEEGLNNEEDVPMDKGRSSIDSSMSENLSDTDELIIKGAEMIV